MEQLIVALIGLGVEYGPDVVKDFSALIHGNPQQQGEADDAYVARLKAVVAANTASVDKQDDAIQAG